MSTPPRSDPGRRERKRLLQLDHLADTAWALFDAEGYEAVTMERIAAVADVAKGTLYKHFPVKEALLRHRFHRELREGLERLQPVVLAEAPGAARLRRFFDLSAQWSERHRPSCQNGATLGSAAATEALAAVVSHTVRAVIGAACKLASKPAAYIHHIPHKLVRSRPTEPARAVLLATTSNL